MLQSLSGLLSLLLPLLLTLTMRERRSTVHASNPMSMRDMLVLIK